MAQGMHNLSQPAPHPTRDMDILMKTTTHILLAATTAACLTIPALDASACDYTLDHTPPTPYPEQSYPNWGVQDDFPSNGFFLVTSDEETFESDWTHDSDGSTLELTRDATNIVDWSTESKTYYTYRGAYRPTSPLTPGSRYTSRRCSSGDDTCGFIVGPPDDVAPNAPVLIDYSVNLHKNPRSGGAAGCPDLDMLTLTLEVSDDRTKPDNLVGMAYIAEDAATVTALITPTLTFKPHESWRASSELDPKAISFALGEAVSRARDGFGFRREGPYCFALAVMDRAGNVGPKTDPVCITTTDEDAPYVSFEPGRFACSAAPTHPPTELPLGLALVSFGAFFAFTKRRERDDT